MSPRIGAVVLALLLSALMTSGSAVAAAPRASFPDVEAEVMCDTCNVPLNIAESTRADQLRREIRAMIAQGRTKRQIEDRLVVEYGSNILALPPRKGFSLAAYLVPIVIALGLLALLVTLIPRWRRRGGDAPRDPDGPAFSLADERRLSDDLARFDA